MQSYLQCILKLLTWMSFLSYILSYYHNKKKIHRFDGIHQENHVRTLNRLWGTVLNTNMLPVESSKMADSCDGSDSGSAGHVTIRYHHCVFVQKLSVMIKLPNILEIIYRSQHPNETDTLNIIYSTFNCFQQKQSSFTKKTTPNSTNLNQQQPNPTKKQHLLFFRAISQAHPFLPKFPNCFLPNSTKPV